jgi:hypothetical protein
MTKAFLLFRNGRRLCAARRELARLDVPLRMGGRTFEPVGDFTHLSHVTDGKGRLLGFMVDSLDRVSSAAPWRAWWDSFDNRHLIDFWQAYIFLAEPMPGDWHDDGALLVLGGWVSGDGTGEYLLAIPDCNGYCFRPNEPTVFWTDLGFELTASAITEDGQKSYP